MILQVMVHDHDLVVTRQLVQLVIDPCNVAQGHITIRSSGIVPQTENRDRVDADKGIRADKFEIGNRRSLGMQRVAKQFGKARLERADIFCYVGLLTGQLKRRSSAAECGPPRIS